MFIDIHGHFTTVPAPIKDWRDRQIAEIERGHHLEPDVDVSDAQLAEAIEAGQLARQREHGIDLTIFSPIAGRMAHHYGDQETSVTWSRLSNDTIARVVQLFPGSFIGAGQLPQSPGGGIEACVAEVDRCVKDLDFVGFNLNPDPSDGYWQAPALTDEYYFPLYEKLIEYGVPAMVHSSMSCNPAVHGTGAHYLNGDTTAFMQLIQSDLFERFPDLKLIIPHGGGAIPYHWGRYRGLMQDQGRRPLEDIVGHNIYFDTCVYWQPGMDLLVNTVPPSNVLFASEMIGAVRSKNPDSGRYYDDTRFLLESTALSPQDLDRISHQNAFEVFGRLEAALDRTRKHERS
jgi:4-oxalmesaconate hydratase